MFTSVREKVGVDALECGLVHRTRWTFLWKRKKGSTEITFFSVLCLENRRVEKNGTRQKRVVKSGKKSSNGALPRQRRPSNDSIIYGRSEQTNTQRAERSWKRWCWSNSKAGVERELQKESSAANVVAIVVVVVVEFSVVVGNSFQAGALQHKMYFYAVFLLSFQS